MKLRKNNLQIGKALSSVLKNSKGEIKSSLLSDLDLDKFAERVMNTDPLVHITPISIIPAENPHDVVVSQKELPLAGIYDGIIRYNKRGMFKQARTWQDFSNWFRNLNYQQHIKLIMLAPIMYKSLNNAIIFSVAGNNDFELIDMSYKIDEDFIKSGSTSIFWHIILRGQLYDLSRKNPIPEIHEWVENGHPFIEKYYSKDVANFKTLFWDNCKFVKSHESFEIRIADTVCTILSKYTNDKACEDAYLKLKPLFLLEDRMILYKLNRFDINNFGEEQFLNPWDKL